MSSQSKEIRNNELPIGVFDSGVGGLSIARCIAEQLPCEDIVYLADSRYAPYGDKSSSFITQRVNKISALLERKQCKAIVVACNTATVNAIDQLRRRTAIPIIGVEPAIKPASHASANNKVAILVTDATAKNQRFLQLVKQYEYNTDIFIQPCPGLVELIENGRANSSACDELLNKYVRQVESENVDTIVLGCTHYPFVINNIKRLVSKHTRIVDTALPVTKQLARQLKKFALSASDKKQGTYSFYTTGSAEVQEKTMSALWQDNISLKEIVLE